MLTFPPCCPSCCLLKGPVLMVGRCVCPLEPLQALCLPRRSRPGLMHGQGCPAGSSAPSLPSPCLPQATATLCSGLSCCLKMETGFGDSLCARCHPPVRLLASSLMQTVTAGSTSRARARCWHPAPAEALANGIYS